MPNMKFKRTGAILLESIDGDILITDSSLGIEIIFTNELIKRAKDEPKKAELLAQQFVKFHEGHRNKRWMRIKKELLEVAKEDPAFVKRRKIYIEEETIRNLRKLEKDVHFWKEDNGKNDLERLQKLSNKPTTNNS